MIQKTKKAINTMVEKHKEVINEHKDMMGVHVFLALIVGVVLHMLFPPIHTESKEPMDNDNNIAMIEHYAPSPAKEQKEEVIQASLMEMVNNPNDEQREIPATIAAPNLSLKITPDGKEGFTLFLGTEHFAFTPKKVGMAGENDYYEGHATLYVNDAYVGRIYSSYYHIPDHFLKSGDNIILATLNDNNHKTFSWHDQIIYDADIINMD